MSGLDTNQYGAIPNPSTAMAVISILHGCEWSLGNGATVTTLGNLRFDDGNVNGNVNDNVNDNVTNQ